MPSNSIFLNVPLPETKVCRAAPLLRLCSRSAQLLWSPSLGLQPAARSLPLCSRPSLCAPRRLTPPPARALPPLSLAYLQCVTVAALKAQAMDITGKAPVLPTGCSEVDTGEQAGSR